jgi:hypothetical protein
MTTWAIASARRPSDDMRHTELELAAHHEAGHCIAVLWAFKTARWLPRPAPPLPVRYVEVVAHGSGQWGGNCVALSVYSPRWGTCIAPRFHDLMRRQAVVHLAGGVGEAIARGETRKSHVLRFAKVNCAMDGDLQREQALLFDLRQVTGCDFTEQGLAERTLEMLEAHWGCVTALAEALVEERRIEDPRIQRIIDRSMIRRAS